MNSIKRLVAGLLSILFVAFLYGCGNQNEIPMQTSSIPDTIPLTFTAQDFSNRPLRSLSDSQIGSIVRSTKIDDLITYAQYIPKEFSEEDHEGYTYSYIEISGVRYALSRSLGNTRHDLTKTMLSDTDTVYIINEVRGANYGATIFFEIKERIPTIIAEIDGFAQIIDLDHNGTKEVISSIGTVPSTTIFSFDFDKQAINTANISELSGAEYTVYDTTTNTFALAFASDEDPVTYVYEMNQLLRVK